MATEERIDPGYVPGERETEILREMYDSTQKERIRIENRIRGLSESKEPHPLLESVLQNLRVMESNIKKGLDAYSAKDASGE